MGLTITPLGGDFDFTRRPKWSYGGFNRFRTRLCDLAGLGRLDAYQWFGGDKPWPEAKAEALVPLLAHSDCDGDIQPEHLAALAVRIEGLLPGLTEGVADQYDYQQAVKLIACCREAADKGVPLEFV